MYFEKMLHIFQTVYAYHGPDPLWNVFNIFNMTIYFYTNLNIFRYKSVY